MAAHPRRRRPPRFEEIEARLLYAADMAALSPVAAAWATPQHTRLLMNPADALLDQPLNQALDAMLAQMGSQPLPALARDDGKEHASPLNSTAPREVVFIDGALKEADDLAQRWRSAAAEQGRHLDLVMLDARQDGLDQVSTWLAQAAPVQAVHLVSHGAAGQVRLGNAVLDANTLAARSADLRTWATGLAPGADLLIYGCDVANSNEGQALMAQLRGLTGADVAGSLDRSGAAALGGNWWLESQLGDVQADWAGVAPSIQGWQGTLATFTVTSNADTNTTGTLRWAIEQANATAGADNIAFSGVSNINLTALLPQITGQVSINGTGGGGTPGVTLNGGGLATGLHLVAGSDGSTVRGLVVQNFSSRGIYVVGTGNVTIAGNYVGTDANGNFSVGNNVGIDLFDAANARIGGSTAADRNVVSGNSNIGINIVGSGGAGNAGTVVSGNYIGTNADGLSDLGNTNHGIYINATSGVTVGGSASGAGNLVSGQNFSGVTLGTTATGISLQGNAIGLNVNGNGTISNSNYGIWVLGANNTIGGTSAGARNVISGNGQLGIRLSGASATGNTILGNYIGTGANGTTDLGNSEDGIQLDTGASSNTIGGTSAGAGNVIAGNNNAGIALDDAATSGNIILGNWIGAGADGATQVANSHNGINIGGATGTRIGDGSAAGRNVIAGNAMRGIGINNASGTVIKGNWIVYNGFDGVTLNGTTPGTVIGDTTGAGGNLIAHNGTDGILLWDTTTSATILANSIYANGQRGIDLADNGYDTNDAGDADTGANDRQNFPVLSSATATTTGTTIAGALNSTANTNFRIDFYANRPGEVDGTHGEGARWLGSSTVSTDGSGNASINATLANAWFNHGDRITATATHDLGGGNYGATSEFAANITGSASGVVVVDTTSESYDSGVASGSVTITTLGNNRGTDGRISLREAVFAANNTANGAGADRIVFAIAPNIESGSYVNATLPPTITLTSVLPDITITQAVNIDASTQTGFAGTPLVQLRGNGAVANGLTLAAGSTGSTLRGFIIGNFSANGIFVSGGNTHTIAGNWIGLGRDGLTPDANGQRGIYLSNSTGSTIGGTNSADRNVVSANGQGNLYLQNAVNNIVYGNYIGTDATGLLDPDGAGFVAGRSGIYVDGGSTGNQIGNTIAGARNVISGNNWMGVDIINVAATGNTVSGNFIGTDRTGLAALANAGGVSYWNAGSNNRTVANVLSGNAGAGVGVGSASTGAVIQGNYIGLGVDGVTLVANGNEGVLVQSGATGTLIGTNADGSNDAAEANVISGNINGILVTDAGTTGTLIQGNLIGTDASGLLDRGNTFDGVRLQGGATGNTVGGSLSAQRNLISGNGQDGIQIADEASDGNTVRGNWIGINAAGTATLGNGGDGIFVSSGADNTVIGGTGANDGNWVAGNAIVGVEIDGASTGTVIQGNRIGTDLAGSANWGHQENGVLLENGASNTLVGGTSAAAANTIAFNGQGGVWGAGISVYSTAGTGNSLLGNRVYGSVDLGIDLGGAGVTANDTGDTDTGANNLQNFPVLATARSNASNQLVLTGTLNSTANSFYRIEFFANTSPDASGHGEGQTYLGFANVATDGSGNATISTTLSVNVAVGTFISATATKATDNTYTAFTDTSEFARNIAAVSSNQATLAVTTTADTLDGDTTSISTLLANTGADGLISLREALTAANNTANGGTPDRIVFDIQGSGPHIISLTTVLPAITQALVIDGSTEPDFAANGSRPVVVLDGNDSTGVGLRISATGGGSTIRGLVIRDFSADGIAIDAGADGNTIAGNYVGRFDTTGADAGAGEGNGSTGIYIQSANNIVGGTTAADRNLFGGNGLAGVGIYNATATGNQVIGNYIGLAGDGSTVIANGTSGVRVLNGAAGNTIGGGTAAHRNVISGNAIDGVQINGGSSNTVRGNFIGTDSSGALDRGNTGDGVNISNTAATSQILDNLVSGNDSNGIDLGDTGAVTGTVVQGNLVGTAANGTSALGNGSHGMRVGNGGTANSSTIGSTAGGQGNTIAFNGGDGIHIAASTSVAILGNWVQSNAGLAVDLGADGVTANDSGDADTGANNLQNFPVLATARTNASNQLILTGTLNSTANSFYRIEFFANTSPDASGHGEGQTYLGFANVATDGSGNATISTTLSVNVAVGTFISATATKATDNTYTAFTDTSEFARNIAAVSSNQATLAVTTASDTFDGDTTSISTLLSNMGADGFISLREAITAANNTANGSGGPDRIVFDIAAPLTGGVHVINLGSALPSITQQVVIDAGTEPDFAGAPVVRLDGASAGAGVSGLTLAAGSGGSTIRGLQITRFSARGIDVSSNANVIAGNWIGTDGSSNLGNSQAGVYFLTTASNNTVGGVNPGDANLVAYNGWDGIRINGTGTGNAFLGNAVLSNTEQGIDIGAQGLTANDASDADTGSNNAQNFPVLSNARTNASSQLALTGTLNSTANSYFRIEFFANTSQDGSGYGEGQTYLGFANVATDGSGNASISTTLSANVAVGSFISATATKSDAAYTTFTDTSEFSANLAATAPNTAPTGSDGSVSATEDQPYTFSTANFGYSDTDGDALLQVWVDTLPGTGTLRLSGAALAAGSAVTANDINAGRLTYHPAADAAGASVASFNFRVQDSGGTLGSGADTDASANTLVINLGAVNDAPSFTNGAGSGRVVSSIAAESDSAAATLVQPDGRIVVAGGYNSGGVGNAFLARYNPDGTLDPSFGNAGTVSLSLSPGHDGFSALVRQADGKLLAAGSAQNGSQYNFLVARFHADGSLDSGFGSGGWVQIDFAGGDDVARSIAVQGDGKIVVGGEATLGAPRDFAVVRLNTDGSLDTSFSGDGRASVSIAAGSDDQSHALLLQADGRIVLGGVTDSGGSLDAALVRFNTNGSLDAGFDGDGIRTLAIGTGYDQAVALAQQGDGRLLVAGDSLIAGTPDITLVRLNSDGSLDASFGSGGVVTTPVGASFDYAKAMALQADGRIVVVGEAYNGSNNDVAVLRFTSTGALDTSFSSDGKLTTAVGSATDSGAAVALQGDGSIVVAGRADFANSDTALLRFTADGTADPHFGATTTLGGTVAFTEGAAAVVLDTDVFISDVELGTANNFSGATLTLARHGGANAQDLFSASGTLGALTPGGTLVVGGTTIGTVTTNSGGTLSWSFNASATNALVNSAMRQIAYANTSDAPPASVQVNWTFSDGNSGAQGSGGALTTSGSTTVNITAENDAPVNSVPLNLQATPLDTALVFSSATGNALAVSDVDATTLQVTLSSTHGTLTLASTVGLAFGSGDGNNDAAMVFTGSAAAINNALNGLLFQPSAGYQGGAILSLNTSDLGASGAGGTLLDSDSVNIQVGAARFQQGVDGYAGTQDTWVGAVAPGTDHGSNTTVVADDNSTTDAGLLRFDNLFGSGPGQVPTGATIHGATLSVYVTNNDSLDTVTLHRMLAAWTEAATYSGLAAGVSADGSEAQAAVLATIDAGTSGWVNLSGAGITAAVQAWAQGAANQGFAFVSHSADSWAFASSEHATVNLRPVLTIDYTAPQAPVLGMSGGAASSTENGAAVAVDAALTLTDADSSSLTSATVQISTNYVNGQDLLGFVDQNGISGAWNAGSGTLTLSGSASVAQYQAALRSVTYSNSSDAPSVAVRGVSFQVSDSFATSALASRNVQVVSVNDAPAANDVAASGSEDTASIAITLTGGDVDGTVDRFRLNALPANGLLFTDAALTTLAGTGTDLAASGQALTLYFAPDPNWNGSTSFSFTALDTNGAADASPATATLNVAAVNDAPQGSAPASLVVNEDGSLAVSGLSLADVDAGTGLLRAEISATSGSLAASSGGGVTASGSGTDTLVLTGTLADLNAYLAGASRPVFSPDADFNGTLALTLQVSDGQNSGTGGVLVPGSLDYRFVDGAPAGSNPDAIAASGGSTGVTTGFSLGALASSHSGSTTSFGIVYSGVLDITSAGAYSFAVNADDAATLYLDGNLVASAFFNISSNTVALGAGRHSLELRYAQDSGGFGLAVDVSGPDTGAISTSLFNLPGLGRLASAPATTTVTVSAVNDAPVITAATTDLTFIEGGPAQAIDATGTLTDVDSADFNGGVLLAYVWDNASAGDRLTVAHQGTGPGQVGVSGNNLSYAGTLVGSVSGGTNGDALTVSFNANASVAAVQAVYRNIQFDNTSDAPSTATRGVAIELSDGDGGAATPQSMLVHVQALNDAPVLGFVSGNANVPENAGPVLIAASATLTDPDSADFAGGQLVVQFSANGQAEDRLAVRHQGNGAGQIGVAAGTVSYGGVAIGTLSGGGNGSTPLVVSLNGNASTAAVQALARNITYENISDTPSTAVRTLQGWVSDGDGGTSNVASGTITLLPVNDAPVLATTPGSLSHNENAPASAIDPALNLSDLDSATLSGASVNISVAYAAGEDVLGFVNQNGISGSWNAGTGTLTLSGSATVAQYQAALRSVTYANSSESPSIAVRTVAFQVNDAAANSNVATRQVQVVSIDDAPTTNDSSASGSEDAASIAITLSGSDVDGTVDRLRLNSLPANGLLYTDAALTTLAAINTDIAASGQALTLYFVPNANWNGSTSFSFVARDAVGMTDLSPATASLSVAAVNDAPVLAASGGALVVTENDAPLAVDAGLALSDLDSATLSGATVVITSNYANGQDTLAFVNQNGINGSWTAGTGTLTLSGSASLAHYQDALRTVSYVNSSDDPSTALRTLAFQVNDGAATSNLATRQVQVASVNDAPQSNGTSASGNEGAAFIAITLTGSDGDGTVDRFRLLDLPANGQLYTDAALTTPAAINTDLAASAQALTLYFRPAALWNGSTSFNFVAVDTAGGTDATPATATLTVLPVNDAPSLTTSPGALAYVENDGARALDAGLTLADPDSPTLASASVQFSAGYAAGQDLLDFATGFATSVGISGSWDAGSGTLSLSGVATLAQYQAVLRTVTYSNPSDAPATAARTLQFSINDGAGGSATATRTLTLQAVNDSPSAADATLAAVNEDTLAPAGATLAALFGPGFSDPDASATLAGALLIFNPLQTAQGNWQYSTDGGALWHGVGTVSSTSALALDATSRLRFVPSADYNGSPDALQLRVLDNSWSAGFTIDSNRASVDASIVGGTSAVAATVVGLGTQVLALNDAPRISSDGGGATAVLVRDENSSTVTTVVAPDVDSAGVSFRIVGGADAARFAIDASTGLLNFVAAPDFEAPADADTNNLYEVLVQADDGQGADTQAITVRVVSVNEAPTLLLPTGLDALEDQAVAVPGLQVADVDANLAELDLSVAHGSLSLNLAGGASVVAGASGSASLTLAGNGAQLNAALASLSYQGLPNTSGPDVLQLQVRDSAGLVAGGSLAINVQAVNDAPQIGLPAAPSLPEDGTLAFGTTTTRITLADLDAGNTTLSLHLVASHGSLSLSSTAGLVLGLGSGTGDAELRISGTLADLQAALDGLSFTAAPDFNGQASISLVLDDGGASGGGGALQSAAVLAINVSPVNDAPRITSDGGGSTAALVRNENAQAVTTVVAGDIDSATLGYSIVGGADAARFSIDAGTGVLRFVSAPDTESPTDADGDNTYTVQVQASDGSLSATQTLDVSVLSVNEAPVFTLPAAASGLEDSPLALAGLAVADVDGNLDGLALAVGRGTLTLDLSGGATLSAGANGSASLVLAGSAAQLNAALASLVYQGDLNSSGADTLSLTALESGGPGASATLGLNLAAVNDAPTLSGNTSRLGPGTDENTPSAPISVRSLLADPALGLVDVDSTRLGLALVRTTGLGTWQYRVDGGAWTDLPTLSAHQVLLLPETGDLRYQPDGLHGESAGFEFLPWDRSSGADSASGRPQLADPLAPALRAALAQHSAAGVLDVTEVNDAPTASGGPVALQEDGRHTLGLADFGFQDPDGNALQQVWFDTLPASGLLLLDGQALAAGQAVDAAAITAGRLQYNPAADANGTGLAQVFFRVQDSGGSARGGSDTTTQPGVLRLDVAAVNDAPRFVDDQSQTEWAWAENQPAGGSAAARDIDSATLHHRIVGGADAALFSIDETSGALSLRRPADFEAPADANADNRYELLLQVDDGQASTTQALTVRLQDVNEAPVWAGPDTVVVQDNSISTLVVQASDPDSAPALTYTIVGGADAARFNIDPGSGALSFLEPARYFAPRDADGDNVYRVQVQVSDGALTAVRGVSVAIAALAPLAPAELPQDSGADSPTPPASTAPAASPTVRLVLPAPVALSSGAEAAFTARPGAPATADGGETLGDATVRATRLAPAGSTQARSAASRLGGEGAAEPISPIEQAVADLLAAGNLNSSAFDPMLMNTLVAGSGTRGDGGSAAADGQHGDDNPFSRLRSGAVQAETAVAVLGAGFVWWSLRAAGLLATVLASAPVWRHLDPIPILGGDERERDGEDELDDPDAEAARDEAASQALLEQVRRTTV